MTSLFIKRPKRESAKDQRIRELEESNQKRDNELLVTQEMIATLYEQGGNK